MGDGTVQTMLDRLMMPQGGRPPATVIVAAHPDDETIGLGTLLPQMGDAVFVHVTDGAPRDGADATRAGFATPAEYGRARRRELNAALAQAGIPRVRTIELGVPDQQACARLEFLACRLADLLADLRPACVITHAYEGGHPDHDATAFAVCAACDLLGGRAPLRLEMASYHNSPRGLESCCFLPGNAQQGNVPEVGRLLEEKERAFKRSLLDCFTTQRATLAYLSLEAERLRQAPAYDFTRAPHEGRLFYENFGWGIDGARFCARAAAALAALGMAEAA